MDCSRSVAYEALNSVLSDDHSAEAGDAALREILARVASEEGEDGLQRFAFDVTLKLAELTERFAVVQQLTAVDLADILFLD
jgi:hypothetical protein